MSTSMNMSGTGTMASSTISAAATTPTSSHSMGDMSMGGSSPGCKISMLWNWTTIDACFLSSTWHITTNGMFAVSCIGVAFLVVALEFMRRVGKEYDAAMVHKFQQHATYRGLGGKSQIEAPSPTVLVFRATPLQQVVRSIIHMVQFAVAYLIMLLAMYFNGYIIISIIIGAFLGKFLCDWGPLSAVIGDPAAAKGSPSEDPTVCCG